jgi:ferredoxin-NADP reductase
MLQEAERVVSIDLRPASGDGDFPGFTAGAHIDLHLGNGMVRSYSICNSPDETHRYVVAVLNDRDSRGGSRWIHENLRPGDAITLSAPRNNFGLIEAAPFTVMVAGGIGVTPFLSMIYRLKKINRRSLLLYCVRSRRDAPFMPALEGMIDSRFQLRLHIDEEMGGSPDLRNSFASLGEDTHYYCCGPRGMLDAFSAACDELGYRHRHVERFHAEPIATAAQDHKFSIELARSGKTVTIREDESVLRGLLRQGIAAEYSCEEGVCGACETKVLAGEVDHRDSVLSDAERLANRAMLICVSRCKSKRLVLDL